MANATSPTLMTAVSRVFWLMLGPMLLVLMTYSVIKTGNGWLTAADFGYFIILFAILVARWLEFRGGNPQTAQGEPAQPQHLQRYWIGASLVGIAVWVFANVLANYVLVS